MELKSIVKWKDQNQPAVCVLEAKERLMNAAAIEALVDFDRLVAIFLQG